MQIDRDSIVNISLFEWWYLLGYFGHLGAVLTESGRSKIVETIENLGIWDVPQCQFASQNVRDKVCRAWIWIWCFHEREEECTLLEPDGIEWGVLHFQRGVHLSSETSKALETLRRSVRDWKVWLRVDCLSSSYILPSRMLLKRSSMTVAVKIWIKLLSGLIWKWGKVWIKLVPMTGRLIDIANLLAGVREASP